MTMLTKYDENDIKVRDELFPSKRSEYIVIDDENRVAMAVRSQGKNLIKFRFSASGEWQFQDECKFYPTKMANVTGDSYFSHSPKGHDTYTQFFETFFNIEGMKLYHK